MKKWLIPLLMLLSGAWSQEAVNVDIEMEEDTILVDENGNPLEELPPIEKMPEVKAFVNAEYPEAEMKAGREGTVVMELLISDSGTVDSARVYRGLSPALDSAALRAVRQFRFSPAIAGGQAVPVMIEYLYHFSLKEAAKSIGEYVNFKGTIKEKGTRSPVSEGMVVVTFPDTAMDNGLPLPWSLYLEHIGKFDGQYLEDGRMVTLTDVNGRFAFKSLPACSVRVTFPISGYRTAASREVLERGKQLEMDYRLKRESYDEYEIVVYGKVEKKEVARKTLSISEIKKIPGFGGDAVKVVRALPGVSRPSFVSGDIIIRGSGSEDTRFFLDGVQLPRIFHFGGLRSVYSSSLLSSLDMYPGGFNSRYGGAIGGVVEIKGRPAKTDRWHGEIDVNLLDAGLTLEGPLTEKLSLQVSGRYSYIGTFVELMTKETPVTVVPFYWDGLARLDWNLNKKDHFFLTYNSSWDELEVITSLARGGSDENSENREKAEENNSYHLLLAGYDRTFSKRLKNELRLSLNTDLWDGSAFGYSKWKVEGYGLYVRDELRYAPGDKITLKGGVDAHLDRADYELDIQGAKGYLKNTDVQYFGTLGAYANVEYYPAKRLMLKPGFRYDYYADIEEGQPSLRFTARWEYQKGKFLKGAAGSYSQFPKPWGQATDEAWGNPDLPATRSRHYVAGHEWQFSDLISLDVQTYFNRQYDVPNYTDSTNPQTGKNYNFLPDMEARMYGVEFMLRHDQGKRFFGWISYSLSRSERRAPGPFSEGNVLVADWDPDAWVLGEYDQTHNLQVLGSWRLPRHFETGFRFRYVSGNPMTPLLSYTKNKFKFDSDGRAYVNEMGEAFSDRMDPFLQLDLRVEKKFVFGGWMLGSYLDFRNVNYFFYNSPEYYEYNYDGSKRETVGAIFLPALGITAQF